LLVFAIGLSISEGDDLLTRATLLRETMSHPSQIITDAVAAIDREDWAAFIDLCDPVSVRRFKNELVSQFSDNGYSRGVEVEDFLEEMPEIPREVAEHYVEEMNSKRDPAYRLSIELSTVSSLAELQGLEPAEVLVRWLQSRMIRREDDFSVRKWGPSRGLEVTEIRRLSQEELDSDFIYKPQYVVLGSVRDGSEFAHVICRHAGRSYAPDEEDSGDYSTPQDEAALSHALENRSLMLTALCRRQADGTWRLIAERNLFFLPQMSIVT
jgi:hypothetical protein